MTRLTQQLRDAGLAPELTTAVPATDNTIPVPAISLTQQLFDAGLAPEGTTCLDAKDGPFYYTPTGRRWQPETDWRDAMWFVERYKLELEYVAYSQVWVSHVDMPNMPRLWSDDVATFATLPAAICRLVIKLLDTGE